ncbi:hypothetical protein BaRGS_00019305 [Batillaria attramentaria]|uniref:Threonylcarbamoyl-AMP synthase n=1 Tax=Batillaria attramentaria TaxID=370345 RepID=A0ABD0KQE9_9CAEN
MAASKAKEVGNTTKVRSSSRQFVKNRRNQVHADDMPRKQPENLFLGPPAIKGRQKETKKSEVGPPCPLLDSHKASSLQRAARLLDEGQVVGVPTDTVYALAASCKHPASITRLYHVKGRPPEKPICLCLSSLDQLAEAEPPFSDLLWDFMRRCYPGGISCVVPKGEWLQRLGLGEAVHYVGTKDSICIRVPDCAALAYIVSMHGPIAITSANISGGDDSIHHDMVVDTLGHKIDVMVCDGDSKQLQPSTVVNCTKIDQGVISYFREGCTPIAYVNQLFEEAKSAMKFKPCPLLDSHKASTLQTAARLLDEGQVVGVPTDTVYALAASCKHPASITRLYHVKGRPPEKPICLCLSSLDQLAEAEPPFSDLLWDFMRRCYPGGISCVVPKGEWLQRLGLGEAVHYVGTKDSICIRVPDCAALAYIVSMHGPIAITSANISGGDDSIHHDMVVDTLGHKIDAMVCDGESKQLAPSTVVNCLKIDQGIISYFREGCTPIEYVDSLFDDAKAAMRNKNEK